MSNASKLSSLSNAEKTIKNKQGPDEKDAPKESENIGNQKEKSETQNEKK